ncbi:MAG: hypothetical protein JO228_08605 [Xanthobacteraceae bacterium]|nr:hypothetical protein [Xanthobacteraceae bacterium]
MAALNTFISRTIAWYLVIAGAITAISVLFAIDIGLFTPMFGDLVDYTPASVPALRHWGFMIFGIGVLMIAAAFRPWLRFETMLFCTLEKGFIVYLFLSNLGEPWIRGYLGAAIVDGTIATYGVLFFLSDQGRPAHWIKDEGSNPR